MLSALTRGLLPVPACRLTASRTREGNQVAMHTDRGPRNVTPGGQEAWPGLKLAALIPLSTIITQHSLVDKYCMPALRSCMAKAAHAPAQADPQGAASRTLTHTLENAPACPMGALSRLHNP